MATGTDPVRPRDPVMTDVAALAGVSHQTVSRVLNNHPNVREHTRARVLAAIAELGYRPNRAAKALVTGRSQTIGIVAQNSTLFGPASMLTSFAEAAAGAGFAVSISHGRNLEPDSFREAVEHHLAQRVAAIVVMAPVETASIAAATVAADVPIVTVGGNPAMSRPVVVAVDQTAGARLATRHLLDVGHRTVWHVSGPVDWFDSQGRIEGWRSVLEEAGAEIPPLLTGDWSAESGYQAGQLIARVPDASAVFAANDHLALGVLRALHERGRRVPEDVSVIGFDDVPESAYFIPPLTTVRQDFDAVARETLRCTLEQIETGRCGPPNPIPPTLVQRRSVAPPPR